MRESQQGTRDERMVIEISPERRRKIEMLRTRFESGATRGVEQGSE